MGRILMETTRAVLDDAGRYAATWNPHMTVQRSLVIATALLTTAAVIGCGSNERDTANTIDREGQSPFTYVEDDDPNMVSAIDKARSTVDQFITAFTNSKPSQSAFSIKLPVKDGDRCEYMWTLPVRFVDGKFYGTIKYEPEKVKTVKGGDEVNVAMDQISDWMYVEHRKLVGGYTIRVLRDSMPEKERVEFDKSVSFSIE